MVLLLLFETDVARISIDYQAARVPPAVRTCKDVAIGIYRVDEIAECSCLKLV
jgi:hypothetical protein